MRVLNIACLCARTIVQQSQHFDDFVECLLLWVTGHRMVAEHSPTCKCAVKEHCFIDACCEIVLHQDKVWQNMCCLVAGGQPEVDDE